MLQDVVQMNAFETPQMALKLDGHSVWDPCGTVLLVAVVQLGTVQGFAASYEIVVA